MGTKPLKTTRADRRLKENRHLPAYEDKYRTIKNKHTVVVEPIVKEYTRDQPTIVTPTKPK